MSDPRAQRLAPNRARDAEMRAGAPAALLELPMRILPCRT